MKKTIITLTLMLCLSVATFADTDTLSLDTSKVKLEIPKGVFYLSEGEKKWKLEALSVDLKKKRNVAIAGAAVLSSALLFDYAIIQPAERNFDPNDPAAGNDQIAMMSPGILIWMMKLAGSTMSSMRTSETADAYVDITGSVKPANASWKLFWAGWATTLVSGLVSGVIAVPKLSEYESQIKGAAIGLNVTADLLLLANGIYSILYTGKLKREASEIPVKIVPTLNNGGGGLSLNVRF